MILSGLLGAVRQAPAYAELIHRLREGLYPGRLGLLPGAHPASLAAISIDAQIPVLVITSEANRAPLLVDQIKLWAPELDAYLFPEPGPTFYEVSAWATADARLRIRALQALLRGQPGTVVAASARALMQRTLPAEQFTAYGITLRRSQQIPGGAEKLLRRWLDTGYEPKTVVTQPGEFSRRGGIIDIFPVDASLPARLELWGDEIDSIRLFDPASQRSSAETPALNIPPAREALPLLGPSAAERLAHWFSEQPQTHQNGQANGTAAHAELLRVGSAFPELEFYLPWMFSQSASLLDYLPEQSLIFLESWEALADFTADMEAQAISLRQMQQRTGQIPPDMPLPLVTWGQLGDELSQLRAIELGGPTNARESAFAGLFSPAAHFAGHLPNLLETIEQQTYREQQSVVIASRQAERLSQLTRERGPHMRTALTSHIDDLPEAGTVYLLNCGLAEGWRFTSEDGRPLHLYTDAEIFGWKRPEPRRQAPARLPNPEAFFADLNPNDVVVHSEYGIGRFMGLNKRSIDGVEREFLILSFAAGDTLYVPIHQADRITRYIGPDDAEPELTRLGSADWGRIRAKAQQAAEELAEELLTLYAAREAVQGHAFNADTTWQHELEASFPYVETADQLRALQEVKADMERTRPMDRLICGDVGYGKTEIALRAAFKAVMDGKQVAILVPTTVLAQQHLETFQHRMAAFPVRVDMLSRFRTRLEQQAVIEQLAASGLDIVIGTHRLLGDDVVFNDLGLLIIDEEQRFGVTHKEKLKRMRTEVDVLTLTATPIPRTLYMSLTGVRDISIINTPPEDRLPVLTYVGRRDDDLIRQAVLREIERSGQVFFVHNRVQSIEAETERLQRLVPEARFALGHGQMPEAALEAVMHRFAEQEVDVLVTTTIIEAGLDIANANTLIVDHAERFGLSQLHQLRGRVGRGTHQAYAYFFHPPYNTLTDISRARLDAIKAYADLGAGMDIAMRDLEIRGAGDILGARQHGHIALVGFHLYTRMLAQAVKALREGGPIEAGLAGGPMITIDLPLPTYIPTDYVADLPLRINLYRRMAEIEAEAQITALRSELADRFGPLPEAVEGLLYQLRVKLMAQAIEANAVVTENNQIAIRLPHMAALDRQELQTGLGPGVRISRSGLWLPADPANWQQKLLQVLGRLQHVRKVQPAQWDALAH